MSGVTRTAWVRRGDLMVEADSGPQEDEVQIVRYTDHLAALERVRVETRVEERAGLIRDARQQRAYYRERFGSQPGWGELMMMLEDDWLARQRAGEFDDEVAVKIRAARVETLREVWEAVNREQAWSLSSARMQTKCLAAIDLLINATTTGDTDD